MCDQCQAMNINGVACHETGCPNRDKDPRTGKTYPRECDWCDTEYVPADGEEFCCVECAESYWK